MSDTIAKEVPSSKALFPEQDEDGIDVSLIDYMLSLTPDQRLHMLEDWVALDKAMTDARIKHYGFDPRDVVEAELRRD
jgi:hypothetical protein